jgi:hypothetical protein
MKKINRKMPLQGLESLDHRVCSSHSQQRTGAQTNRRYVGQKRSLAAWRSLQITGSNQPCSHPSIRLHMRLAADQQVP